MKETQLICKECQTVFRVQRKTPYCTCGGMLGVETLEEELNDEMIQQTNLTEDHFYRDLSEQKGKQWANTPPVEEVTPLEQLDSDNEHIYLKLDYKLPENSYFERTSAWLMKKLKQQAITSIVLTASNYTNLSIARQAEHASIPCELYIPEGITSELVTQFRNVGVSIHHFEYQQDDCVDKNVFIATDNHPYLTEGAKIFAYELWNQLGKCGPDIVVFSLESGLLILGAYYGFLELQKHNSIKILPKFIIVDTIPSLKCEGVSLSPSMYKEVTKIIKVTDGHLQTIPTSAVIQAEKALLIRGHQVNRQSAAAYAGCMRYYRDHSIKNETIVIPLSHMADTEKNFENDGVRNER